MFASKSVLGLTLLLLSIIVLPIACGKKGPNLESGRFPYQSSPAEATGITLREAWGEIASIQAPEGVDTTLFAKLRAELEGALLARGLERFPSKAPTQDILNRIVLTVSSTGLIWQEARAGNWNNDGSVSAQDLSPIALFFGDSADPMKPDYKKYAEYLDGNLDGTLNAGDISPIALHFGESTGGYTIYQADDGQGTGALKAASITRPSVPDDPGNPPLGQSLATLQYDTSTGNVDPPGWMPQEGKFYQVVPFDTSTPPEESVSVKSEWLEFPTPTNELPVAIAQANPKSGRIPLAVNFSASGSYDPDGAIVLYEWDFQDDGTYDFQSPTGGATQFVYQNAGAYLSRLRLTDNNGASSTAYVLIAVYPLENRPPRAVANADPVQGNAPLTVRFSPTGSYDPDGPIVLYEWDFEDDGTYDISNATGDAQHTYIGGYYRARLRISDEWGLVGTDTVQIVVKSGPGDWSMYGRDPTHQRRSPFLGPQTSNVKWTYPLSGARSAPGVSSDGTLYVAGGNPVDGLFAIASNGSLLWIYQTNETEWSSPAIGLDGTIYFGSRDRNVYAINPDGTMKWRYLTGAPLLSSPVIGADGTIYIGGSDGYVYAFNPDGTVKWKYAMISPYGLVPALGADGTLYFGDKDQNGVGILCAVNQDGTLGWQFQTEQDLNVGHPTLSEDGTVYFTSRRGVSPPYEGYLYSINPNHSLRWRYPIGDPIDAVALSQDGTVYVASLDGYLDAVGPEGIQRWRYTVERSVEGNFGPTDPSISSDGTIYFGTSGDSILLLDYGYLYALNQDGTLKWRYFTGESVSSTVIGPDETLLVHADQAYLYSFGEWKDNQPPVAVPEAAPTLGVPPLNVSFNAAKSYDPDGTIVKYEWDFTSDGYYDADWQTAQATYQTPGIYRVTLRVTDDRQASATASLAIIVNAPPFAQANAEPDNGFAPLTVNFNANGSGDSDGNIQLYEWDYTDDGVYDYSNWTGSGLYTYNTPGDYTARLRVTDNYGYTGEDTVNINVYSP